jgi:hypothetical protein
MLNNQLITIQIAVFRPAFITEYAGRWLNVSFLII